MPESGRNNRTAEYVVIGLMSGTSLDGLDIACCRFRLDGESWQYDVLAAETISYDESWSSRLATTEKGSAFDYVLSDVEYGHLLGRYARAFIEKYGVVPGFIASHGHTIFHQPDKQLTSQIGRGSAIAAETGLPVICDFRSLDVALGGQGAPLVPVGDALLFSAFDYCLNIGGFANISFTESGKRTAFDVCPANIVLNHLAGMAEHAFDPGGRIARSGTVDTTLLNELNSLSYYKQPPPKSLGKEWVLSAVHPMLEGSALPLEDRLSTFTEHIAIQVAAATGNKWQTRMLVTGGGAHNAYLIERIRKHSTPEIVIPDRMTVDFKEAIVFAFLGLLRHRGEINCLNSVTGAAKDTSSGAVYQPF